MENAKNLRVADQPLLSNGHKDFAVRDTASATDNSLKILMATLAVAFSVAFFVYHQMVFGAMLLTPAGLALLMLARQGDKYKKMLTNTEFLNALFSSVLAKGYDFCIIVDRGNGKIIYLNRGFQKIFPELMQLEDRSIEDLLSKYKVTPAAQKDIFTAIRKDAVKKIPVKMKLGIREFTIALSLEPVARPTGFCLMRGKLEPATKTK